MDIELDCKTDGQIFLRSNGLLTRKLEQDDVKRRLLGHWVSGMLAWQIVTGVRFTQNFLISGSRS